MKRRTSPSFLRAIALHLAVVCLAASSAAVSAAPEPFVPALRADFPDPFVLQAGGRWLAYATNPDLGKVNVQMATSEDLVHWQQLRDQSGKLHDAMPVLPPWAKAGDTWRPK